jgi:hypothetical protein
MSRASNRHVWVFREMRTGGTAFSAELSAVLAKKFNFVIESLDDAIISPDVLNNTHNFDLIEDVVKICNPILIRVTRRNKTQQMLSKQAIIHSANVMADKAIINIMPDTTEEQLAGFDELVKNHPVTIEEKDVIGFAKQYLEYDSLWKKHGSLVENTTIYYEDLLNPISLPIVNLPRISFLDNRKHTAKLPEKYKNRLFANITEIGQWMEKHYYEHRT